MLFSKKNTRNQTNIRQRGQSWRGWLLLAICTILAACQNSSGSADAQNVTQDASGITVTSNVSQPVLRATLPASWDENWFASPAVFDLDADGAPEIIAARHSVLYVWNADATLRWRAPVGEPATSANNHGAYRQYASPVVGDLDNDGYGEIAIAYSNKAAVYDHSGALKSGWPQSFPGSAGEIRSLAAADLDNDGEQEILAVKTASGPVTVVWNLDGSVAAGWPQAQGYADAHDYGGYNQNIGAADLTGDNLPEVVSTYDTSHIGIMTGSGAPLSAHAMFTGAYVSSVPMFHDIDLAIQGWGANGNDRDEFTDSPPVFGDIDGDGYREVVVYADHELAGEYVNRGNSLWVLNADLTRPPGFEQPLTTGMPLYTGYENNIVQVAPALSLGNLAGDGRPEIIAPSYDGHLYAYSPDGAVLWTYCFDTAAEPFIGASGCALGDLDDDGQAEIIFNTYSTAADVSSLIILNASGQLLHRISLAGRGDMSVPSLADVDNDGTLEIIISLKDALGSGLGGVQIWEVASARTGYLPWPTGRGNYLRNGTGM